MLSLLVFVLLGEQKDVQRHVEQLVKAIQIVKKNMEKGGFVIRISVNVYHLVMKYVIMGKMMMGMER